MDVRGIKMKRKIILIMIILILILLMPNTIIRILDTLCILLLIFTIVTWIIYRKHCIYITPNLLSNFKRDYAYIHLGRNRLGRFNENVLELANLRRNLYTDIKLVDRFYSLLKNKGHMLFEIYNDKEYICSNKISCFDYCLMHPVVVYCEKKSIYRYVYNYKEILTGYAYLYYHLFKRRTGKCTDKELEIFRSQLNKLISFASKRDIYLELKLIGFSKAVEKKLKQEYPEITIRTESELECIVT